MCGGGGWDPGEATDDTQMAVLVAESLLERGGLDLPDIFARFQRWAASEPKDIGLQTEDVLTNGMPWHLAAAMHFQVNQRAAGNGSLMRASTSAVHFAPAGQEATMDAARRIAALTHGDRAAWEGTAIFHALIRVMFQDTDPLAALPDILALVHPGHRGRYAAVLAPDWHPDQATEFNGAVWPCLGSAIWALRTTSSFEEAIRAAGRNPRPLDPAAPCPPPRIRWAGAAPGRSARPCTPPRRLNRVLLNAPDLAKPDGPRGRSWMRLRCRRMAGLPGGWCPRHWLREVRRGLRRTLLPSADRPGGSGDPAPGTLGRLRDQGGPRLLAEALVRHRLTLGRAAGAVPGAQARRR